MGQRINIHEIQPQAFKGMFALEEYLTSSKLNKQQISLIKMRASQINGCAYCLNMHFKEAIKAGESQQRLHLLNAWKESALFTEAEMALLQLTEEITMIKNGLSDKSYQNALLHFDDETIAAIIMTITVINSWNRIAISTNMPFDKG